MMRPFMQWFRPRPLYSLHIPKTGGSSVRTWMAAGLGDKLCPAGLADDLVKLPPVELVHYTAFAGHFHTYLAPYLGRKLTTFTVLRDPMARTRSHWHQVRRAPNHPQHPRVRDQSFTEFVEDNRNRVMIENYQARYLVASVDFMALARRLADDQSYGVLSETLERASLEAQEVSKALLLAKSIETLRGLAVVGVVERLHDVLVAVAKLHRLPAPSVDAVPRVNVTLRNDADPLPAATLARLRELTQIDQTLYNVARKSPDLNAFRHVNLLKRTLRLGSWMAA
jgi:hypothetical protein